MPPFIEAVTGFVTHPLFKIAVVFVFLIVLLRLRLAFAYVLGLGAVLLALLFGSPLKTFGAAFLELDFVSGTVRLTLTVLMLNLLGQLYAASGDMARLIAALEHLLRDSRAVLALVPSFIGFLPMPGGAMLSAPAVQEVGERIGLPAQDRVVINFWFRHVWEYISPLYPGLILLLGFEWLKVDYVTLLWTLFPMTVICIVVGVVFCLVPIGRKAVEILPGRRLRHSLRDLYRPLWPILVVTLGAAVFGKEWILPILAPVIALVALQGRLLESPRDRGLVVLIALGIGTPAAISALTGAGVWDIVLLAPVAAVLALIWKIPIGRLVVACRKGFSYSIGSAVVGICVFKAVVTPSGAAESLAQSLKELGLHPNILLFAVPFLVGLLTGATMVFVSTAIVLLGEAGMIVAGPSLLLAYASGMMGVMVTPVHVCLSLTVEYFKSSFGPVYRKLIPIVIVVLICAGLLAWLGWPPGLG